MRCYECGFYWNGDCRGPTPKNHVHQWNRACGDFVPPCFRRYGDKGDACKTCEKREQCFLGLPYYLLKERFYQKALDNGIPALLEMVKRGEL